MLMCHIKYNVYYKIWAVAAVSAVANDIMYMAGRLHRCVVRTMDVG